MSKQERVVCAAVRFEKGIDVGLVEYNTDVLCVNYGDNNIEEARFRFENCSYFFLKREVEGFITNKNRFVDPAEALKITGWGNQLRFKDRKYLLPEDLY